MMRGYHKSSWNNLPWLSLLASSLALSLVLTGTGCQLWPASSGKGLQPADTGTARRAVPPLEGRIESSATAHQEMIPERSVQAVVGDIANGATVSLIDADTGQTVSTTVSAPDGRFSLQFPASFVPAQNKPYYLEAIKGLAVGGKANRAGASLARLRTLVVNNASWNSLSVTSVSLGRATTAVATIAGLRALDTGAQLLLLGKVSGTSFTAAGTSIDQAEYDRVFALVTAALEGDQDPLEVIAYDASGLAATTKYRSKPGQLVIHDSFAPALAATGDVVTFRGQNFPTSGVATPQIAISGVPLASWSVNASRSALAVTLPDNGYSGYLQITQGASSWFGPFVKVRGTVGTLAGSGVAGFADGPAATARLKPVGIAVDQQGNVIVGDYENRRVRKISNGVVTTLAGNGVSVTQDGTGTSASFRAVYGVAVDSNGNVYVAELTGHVIRKITPSGVVTTLAGNGIAGGADGTGTSAQFSAPVGVTVDSADNIYIAEYDGHRIRKISPAGVVSTLAGDGIAGYADGTGAAARFYSPYGITADTSGNLYVADLNNRRIRKITPAGVVSTLAGDGTNQTLDGVGTSAAFTTPIGIASAANGNLYVAEEYGQVLRQITPGGVVSTVAGTGIADFSDGPALAARFRNPYHLAVGPEGNVYVADWNNNRVRVLTPW